MMLPDARLAELQDACMAIEHAWRVASDRNFPDSPEWNAFFAIAQEHGANGIDWLLPEFAIGWLKTKNPHYVDLAVCHARHLGIEWGPSLRSLVEEAAEVRGNGSENAGGPLRIKRDVARGLAFTMMGIFIVCTKAKLKDAASKAAQWLSKFAPDQAITAGTLEREYPKKWRQRLSAPDVFSKPMSREEYLANDYMDNLGWGMAHPRRQETVSESWGALYRAMPFAADEIAGSRH